ncbi:MAG: hypothetical protein M1484_03350 [Patescibacteria group bacterium]|nr:hypothetical protein [Patescibacteria group bacterium]MCL5432098.1 hypothetical protein [Patescibacteria group bacterium]
MIDNIKDFGLSSWDDVGGEAGYRKPLSQTAGKFWAELSGDNPTLE